MNEENPAETGAREGVSTSAATPNPDPGSAAATAKERARRKHRRFAAFSIAAAVLLSAGAGSGAVATLALTRSTTSIAQSGTASAPQSDSFGPGAFGWSGAAGSGTSGTQSGGSTTQTSTTATSDQVAGLVTIVSRLGYQDGEAAGTGIILTSTGRILTNNHVIDGATSIEVTDEATGKTYKADVVGTDATEDIAVLQLRNASGLDPADLATTAASAGQAVTAIGNANGTGTLSAATGTVTATDQSITTQSEDGTAGENLTGMLEIDADVVSGDSGGAIENAQGDVVAITTAASSGTADITGYGIPIATALSIANQIVSGDDTAEITLGLPAFLGIALASSTDGAVIGNVIDDTPAASAGLAAGDTITALDGTAVGSPDALSTAIAAHAPGDTVKITYTTEDGTSKTVSVTLTTGPAD